MASASSLVLKASFWDNLVIGLIKTYANVKRFGMVEHAHWFYIWFHLHYEGHSNWHTVGLRKFEDILV